MQQHFIYATKIFIFNKKYFYAMQEKYIYATEIYLIKKKIYMQQKIFLCNKQIFTCKKKIYMQGNFIFKVFKELKSGLYFIKSYFKDVFPVAL